VPDASKPDFRFLQIYRLKLRSDFNIVFEKGLVAADHTLVTHAVRNSLGYTRIGLSISKRVGSAPMRNRWKRWMREAYRLNRHDLPTGLDVVIRPRREAQGSFHAVEKSMRKLFRELDRKLPAIRQ
jgi:ribonuclease P protein component